MSDYPPHKCDKKTKGMQKTAKIGNEMITFQTLYCSVCTKSQENKILKRRKIK